MDTPCSICPCKSFVPNLWNASKCSTCLHNHQKRSSDTPPPLPIKPQYKAVSNNVSSPSPPVPKRPTMPPPSPSFSTTASPPSNSAPSTPPPTRPPTQSVYSAKLGAKSNSSPDVLRATPKVDSPSKLTTSARNLNATSTTNTSPNTATSNNGGIFRKMKNKAKTMLGGSEASNAPGSMVIGTPTFVRHETHVGFSSATGAFETRNLPPELQWLFEELDGTLKAMGVKGITKDEAKYLLNTLIAAGVDPKSMVPSASAASQLDSAESNIVAAPKVVRSPKPQPPVPAIASAPVATEAKPALPPKKPKPVPTLSQLEIDALKTQLIQLEEKVKLQKETNAKLTQENLQLEKQAKRSEAQQQASEKDVKEKQNELRFINEKLQSETKAKVEIEKQSRQLELKIKELTAEWEIKAQTSGASEQEKLRLEINMQSLKVEHAAAINLLESKVHNEIEKGSNMAKNMRDLEATNTKLEHEVNRLKVQLSSAQDKSQDADNGAQQLRTSFEKEIADLRQKNLDDISALNAKLVQETKTKDEQEKKIRTLEDSVKELNNKLDASNKTKENEEALKNKFAIELSKLKGTYEKQIAELETTLAAERENARIEKDKDTREKTKAESELAHMSTRVNEESEVSKKHISILQQKVEDIERQNSDLQKSYATMLAKVEEYNFEKLKLANSDDAQPEMVAPPLAPPPPALMSLDPVPKKPPAARPTNDSLPAPDDGRNALMTQINSNKFTLKQVRKSMIAKAKGAGTPDANNIVGILARALLDRRSDMVDDDNDDGEPWDGDD